MQAATNSVRRRWPLAAGVTATATAIFLAGIQAYGAKPVEQNSRECSSVESSSCETPSPPIIPRTPSPKKKIYTSIIHAPHFRYFLGPILIGILVGTYIVLLHFEMIDVSEYPSTWDMFARFTLWIYTFFHGIILWPYQTESSRLHQYRANVTQWLSTSPFMAFYVSSITYLQCMLIGLPMLLLSAEYHLGIINWTDCQFYALLAILGLTMSNVLWYNYTLVHLNSNLRHI